MIQAVPNAPNIDWTNPLFVQRLPHLLLYGPPGTGKTSTILALARRIYGVKNMRQMVLELNASDDRGIDVVRDQIKTFASSSSTPLDIHLVT